jgi:hypothetical protein
LERLGDDVAVVERSERLLEIACRPDHKTALLGRLDGLWQLVDDVTLLTPGLPAIYSRLVEEVERT